MNEQKEVIFSCTRYNEEERRADIRSSDGKIMKDVVVVKSTYTELGKFDKVLLILPNNGRLSPKKAVTFISQETNAVIEVPSHWAYGGQRLAFKIYPSNAGLSIRNHKNIPLGRKCLVDLVVKGKSHPVHGKQLIVDVYVCKNQNEIPDYCFDYDDYAHNKAEDNFFIFGIKKFLRIWKWSKGSRPKACLHEDELK